MKYLRRKLWRDLGKMKFQGVLIVLSVGFAVGMYGGLLLIKDNAFASRDEIMERSLYEDVRFRFFGFEDENEVVDAISGVSTIESYEVRLSLDVVMEFREKSFPGTLHGIHAEQSPRVNGFINEQGDYFSGEVNQTESLIVEERFAVANGIDMGDQITVKLGGWAVNLTVAEIAFAPEHMYSMNPNSGLPERGNYGTIWYSLDRLVERLSIPHVVNEVLIRYDGSGSLERMVAATRSALEERGFSAQPILWDEEIDYKMMSEDIGTMDEISVAIGAIILLVAAFVIYDTIVKLINNQRTQIGVIRALGGSPFTLITHYTSYGILLTTAGILVGIPIGYGITWVSTEVFVRALGLAPIKTIFRVSTFIPSIVLSLSIAFFAGLVSSSKIMSVTPVDAISNQGVTRGFNRRTRGEKLFEKVLHRHRFSMKIPVRNVLLRRRRSLMTATTIALAAIIILASFGFLDSFFNQIDTFYEENYHYNMEVSFNSPVSMAFVGNQLDSIGGIGEYEGMVKQPLYLIGPEQNASSILFAYRANSTMRTFTFESGGLGEGEIAIGQILARKLGVHIGDQVKIITLGKTVFSTIVRNYTVGGITREFIDQFVFMNLETLQRDFLFGSTVNAVAMKVTGDTEQVKRELFQSSLPINSITDLESSKKSFVELMEAIIAFADFIKVMGVIVLLLFSLNVVVLDVMERRREFVNIRVNGGGLADVTRIIAMQIGLITLAVMLIDYLIHPFFTQFIIDMSLKDMIYVGFYIKPASLIIGLSLLFVGIGIGVFMAIRETLTLNIVDEIRVRFRS